MNLLLAVTVGFLTAQVALFATTVYLHRGITHRGLTMRPATALPFRIFLWLATGIRPREWAGVHRRHHAALDTRDDPHSPAMVGLWKVQLLNIAMYHRAAHDRDEVARYTHDLADNRLDHWVFDHETIGPLLGLGFLCLVLGWPTGLVAGLVHLVVYVGLNGAINSWGHAAGTRPNENSATNGRVLALLTAGEGLHNNHHAAPTAARFSHRAGQIDPSWWFIRLLGCARLLTVRHEGGLLPAPREHGRELACVG